MLLQALNNQNQAAIDERLATEGVKDWINNRALPGQLDNPIRHLQNVTGITSLAFASLVSDEATVRQLVEADTDIAITDSRDFLDEVYSALHYACTSDVDSDAKVAYLMQRGVTSKTATVAFVQVYTISLHLAARLNQADRVRALIQYHGASVNATDQDGHMALHVAAEAGSAEAVRVLAQYPDCRVNATDRLGGTALHLAAKAGQAEAVKVLVQQPDCRINATAWWDRTALHLAAGSGRAEAVKVLVQHPDCRVNATDCCGWTSLHDAARAGHTESVKVFVSHPSCDVSITDEDGRTAADLARSEGHDDIAALIEAKVDFTNHS